MGLEFVAISNLCSDVLGSDLDLNPLVDQGFIIKNQLRAIGRLI